MLVHSLSSSPTFCSRNKNLSKTLKMASSSSVSSSTKTRIIPFSIMDLCETVEEWDEFFDHVSKAPTNYCHMLVESMKWLGRHNIEKRPKKPFHEGKEDRNALYFKMEIPKVVKKENIQITVENGAVIIIGNQVIPGEKEEDNSTQSLFKGQMFLRPLRIYKVDQIKAELKNGILNIMIPKDVKNKTEVMNNDEVITVKVD